MYATLYSNKYLKKETDKMKKEGYSEQECRAFKHDLESANMLLICKQACKDDVKARKLMRLIDPKIPVVDNLELFSYHVLACVERETGEHVVALWRDE